jgi:FixJ family two-component response regulator
MPQKTLIAIVDDDESIRVTTKDLIESAGLRAVTFASAEAFLASGQLPAVACIVSDMRMGGMSGLSLHQHLVASGRAVPMILMTAYPDEAARARALSAGVNAFIVKPFTDDELLGCIGCAVGAA